MPSVARPVALGATSAEVIGRSAGGRVPGTQGAGEKAIVAGARQSRTARRAAAAILGQLRAERGSESRFMAFAGASGCGRPSGWEGIGSLFGENGVWGTSSRQA